MTPSLDLKERHGHDLHSLATAPHATVKALRALEPPELTNSARDRWDRGSRSGFLIRLPHLINIPMALIRFNDDLVRVNVESALDNWMPLPQGEDRSDLVGVDVATHEN